ncbi:MAG: hypothetical protein ACRD3N_08390 [Terracidiphilus sp.]
MLSIVAMGGWLLFVANISTDDLVLGAGCALLSLLVSALAWHRMNLYFSPSPRQVMDLWRLTWDVFCDTWKMFVILLRALAGRQPGSYYRAVPFHVAKDSHGVSQIILATAAITVSPNSIVIGASRGRMLFHQVERSGIPRLITDVEASR